MRGTRVETSLDVVLAQGVRVLMRRRERERWVEGLVGPVVG